MKMPSKAQRWAASLPDKSVTKRVLDGGRPEDNERLTRFLYHRMRALVNAGRHSCRSRRHRYWIRVADRRQYAASRAACRIMGLA